jgi:hypothetical protein
MTIPTGNEAAPAYTRTSVLAYLKAAEEERQRIKLAIAEARYRKELAMSRIDRLDALEPEHPAWSGSNGVREDRPALADSASNGQAQWSVASNEVDWLPIDPVEVARD